jgi:hypothetical protein
MASRARYQHVADVILVPGQKFRHNQFKRLALPIGGWTNLFSRIRGDYGKLSDAYLIS